MNQHTEPPDHTCKRVQIRTLTERTSGGPVLLTWSQCPACQDTQLRVTCEYAADQDSGHLLVTDSAGAR